jgi:hypothetical protein
VAKWLLEVFLECSPQDAVIACEAVRHKPDVCDARLRKLSDLEAVANLQEWALERCDQKEVKR